MSRRRYDPPSGQLQSRKNTEVGDRLLLPFFTVRIRIARPSTSAEVPQRMQSSPLKVRNGFYLHLTLRSTGDEADWYRGHRPSATGANLGRRGSREASLRRSAVLKLATKLGLARTVQGISVTDGAPCKYNEITVRPSGARWRRMLLDSMRGDARSWSAAS